MKPKYLYIDDESPEQLISIVNGFNDVGIIEVELVNLEELRNFEALKSFIIKQNPNGLIIDLRLDGEGINRLDFPATTLAQDLRTLAASKEISFFPMVLCSTSPKMRKTYDTDKTSHDLFDYKFEKSQSPEWKKFSIKLKSLSDNYKKIVNAKLTIDDILDRKDWKKFDRRIFEKFLDNEYDIFVNDIAQFIIKELFNHQGILIKERNLAARLGVDIELSGEDWEKIKDFFNDCKYNGVFGDGWERWWFDRIEEKFEKISQGTKLQNLNAIQRIEFLNKVGFKLTPAEPIKPYCKSAEYWTICEYFKRPLDPLEGIRIFESNEIKPWQEPRYLSNTAALERRGRDKGLRPHPSELERLEDLKEMFS